MYSLLSYRKPIHSGIIKNSWSISIFPRSWPLPTETRIDDSSNSEHRVGNARSRGVGVALINFPFAMPAKRKRHWRDYFNLHRSVRNYFIEAGWPPPPPTRAKIHRRRFSTKLQFTNIANGLVFNRILVKLESLLWNLGPTIPRDHPQCKLICRLLHDFIYLFFLF